MTTMKGLLKGLRYISQIFDNEKEEEMQIGFPTDVKHVAHIGMDGPSANTPSWMNEFKPTSGVSSTTEPNDNKPATKSSAQDPLSQDTPDMQKSVGAPLDSPTRRSSSKTKQSRRQNNSSGSMGSPAREPSKPRRHKNSGDLESTNQDSSTRPRRVQNTDLGSESPSQDPLGIPKHSHRKKSKGSSGGGSSRSSKSKGMDPLIESSPYSDPGPGHGLKNQEMRPNSVLKVYEEGNECDEISRGIRAL